MHPRRPMTIEIQKPPRRENQETYRQFEIWRWNQCIFKCHVQQSSPMVMISLALAGMIHLTSERTFLSSAATASPTSMVLDVPPMSFVRIPASIVLRTASSTAFDSVGR